MIFINVAFASKATVENMMFNHNSCKNEGIFCTQLSSQKYRWILNSMAEHVWLLLRWFLSAVCLGYSLDRLHISLIFGQLMPYWSAYFLRFKPLRNVGGWLGAFIGYMSADLVTGNHLELTLALTIANFMTVGVSLFFIHYLQIDYRAYNKGLNFLYLFLVCVFLGCFSSAIFAVAVVPYMPYTFMSTQDLWAEFYIWWTGEVLNCISLLPLMLTFPAAKKLKYLWKP